MEQVFGRISFFVNAGVRFIEEHAKLRAMSILWEELGRERYGVKDPAPPALPLRRAGQLARPDRGPAGEQRAADRARGARGDARPRRARPRDPAAGLERGARAAAPVGPAVVAAHPAGARLRDRHPRVPRHLRGLEGDGGLVDELLEGARAEMARRRRARRRGRGRALHEGRAGRTPTASASAGSRPASRSWSARTASPRPRTRRSPPTPRAASWSSTRRSKPSRSRRVRRWRAERDQAAVDAALAELAARRRAPRSADENLMVPTIAAARAGATTGEWARTLREVFGSYRAPTGVGEATPRRAGRRGARASCARRSRACRSGSAADRRSSSASRASTGTPTAPSRSRVRARDAGMDVVYEGIRLTPAQIAASALQEGVHVIGLSILSGSHRELIPAVIDALREAGVQAPVVVGGIIPEQDVAQLLERRASRPSTRPRTSTSRASCATSWRWWTRAPADRRSAAPAPAANGSA